MSDLPSSGDPGIPPPAAGQLPRPPLWPAAGSELPFRGMAEDTADPPSPGRRKLAFVAVAVMILGWIVVGVAVAARSWVLLVLGLVVGAVGAVIAVKVRILEDVSVSDSPEGRA